MVKKPDPDEVLATIHASAPRRWLGVGMMAALGGIVIYIALAEPPAPGWALFLFGFGGAALFAAVKMHAATTREIELTRTELRDSTGTRIAAVAEIESVERGFFAFKPSNGFVLRTRQPGDGRHWQPGMWWRVGRRVGVGGVTAAAQTKFVAELITVLMAERDGKI